MIFMDPMKTGNLIRSLRQKQKLTQLALAEKLCVSDKTISKWERGCGAPDVALLPLLSDALGVDVEALLKGTLAENDKSSGNLKKLRLWVCPQCGNLMVATEEAELRCCGKKAVPLQAQKADPEHSLEIVKNDGAWFITAGHEMRREHYISFLALVTGDTLILKKQYPEWDLEARLTFFAHGTLFWYCTRHGLFYKYL